MKPVLLCDADDTLFDFPAGEEIAIHSLFAAFSIPATQENLAAYHQANRAQWKKLERGETTQARLKADRMRDFLAATGYPLDAEALSARFIYELGQQHVLLPGAATFCQRVSARMPVYLVTNGITEIQKSRVRLSLIAPCLSGMVISEEAGAAKPNPVIVLRALELAGAAPEDAIFLGDSVTADVPAANGAGVPCILFTNGAEPPAGHGAAYVARTYREAEEIMTCHFQGKAVQ